MAIWNDTNEDLLIALIQERPALYDITEKRYSKRVVKTGLWREIETQLGFSEKELRKKWDSLRTQYCGASKTGRQQWVLARLQFIEPYTKRKDSTSNLTITERPVAAESLPEGTSGETSTSTTEEDSFHFDAEPCTPLAESTICTTPAPRLGQRPSTRRPPAKRRMTQDSQEESAVEASSKALLEEIKIILAQLAPVDDEIAVQAKLFEHRLRHLPPHHMQCCASY
ncbi:hypothetical protein CesoFtcFv8_017678 [Champsocephalus esox]|uniref:MADF domain-containing protein n=1 Tax=Champsocephalus esox TaxID=159716 RepID=A0AAN8BM14_9TELE|nr:hypothetical protein CesoFtcFv8_017678 [Champsocephalus esox]